MKTVLLTITGILFAAILSLYAFGRLASAPFLYDDHRVVEPIANVQPNMAGNQVLVEGGTSEIIHSAKFWEQPRPLRHASHLLDAWVWGANPLPSHVVNIVLHLMVVAVGFVLLNILGFPVVWSLAASLVFLVNPITVESIGIVSHRKEMLSALFLLMGLCAATKSWPRLSFWSLPLFFLACCGKETAAIFPALLLICLSASIRGHREDATSIRRKNLMVVLSYFLVAAGFSLLFYWQIHHGMEVVGGNPGEVADRAGHFVSGVPFTVASSAAVRAFPRYWGLLFDPFHHSINPPFDMEVPVSIASLLPGIAFLVLMAAFSMMLFKDRDLVFPPVAWVVVCLSPYLFPPFLQSGAIEVLADRYAYLASFGAAWFLAAILSKIPRSLGMFPLAGVWAVFAWQSNACSAHYHDETALWEYTLRCNPQSFLAAHNLGMGRWREHGDFRGAVSAYEEMLHINPKMVFGYIAYSQLHANANDPLTATEILDRGITECPDSAELHRNRAILLFEQNRLEDSLADFRSAAREGAADAGFHHAFAVALAQSLNWDEAATHLRLAARSPVFRGDAAFADALIADPKPRAGRILVVGDSVPHGVAAVDGEGVEHPVATLLAERLGVSTSEVVDSSVPGSTAVQLARSISQTLRESEGEIAQCVVWTGHNDAFFGASSSEVLSSMSSIAIACRMSGIRPLLVGPIPVRSTEERGRSRQEKVLAELDGLLREFCGRHSLRYISSRKILASLPDQSAVLDPSTGNHLLLAPLSAVADELASILVPSAKVEE